MSRFILVLLNGPEAEEAEIFDDQATAEIKAAELEQNGAEDGVAVTVVQEGTLGC